MCARLLQITTITVVLLALSACGGGGNDSGSPPASDTNPPTSEGPPPTTQPPPAASGGTTSSDLVDAGLASGSLDAETALIYRVYADFDDPRLPVEYRGDDTGVVQGTALWEVSQHATTYGLSQPALDILEPFFIPPIYSRSWRASPPPRVLDGNFGDPGEIDLVSWSYVSGTNVVIWYRTANAVTDKPKAEMLVWEIDNVIWPKLTTLMGTAPLSDDATPYRAIDGRYDIYLDDMARQAEGLTAGTRMIGCKAVPARTTLKRSMTDAKLKGQAAHELMHAVQFSYPVQGLCVPSYFTMMESTAVWATNFVYPDSIGNIEHDYADDYLNAAHKPLDQSKRGNLFAYGAYLLPYFASKKLGDGVVKKFWEAATATPDELVAFESGLAGSGTSFAKLWPEFVRANWNQGTETQYQTWDALTLSPDLSIAGDPHREGLLQTAGSVSGDVVAEFSGLSLPHLSANYYRVVLNPTEQGSLIFVNGLTHKLTVEPHAPGETNFEYYWIETLTDAEKEGASVQVLMKVVGQPWAQYDLTDQPFVQFCRDSAAGRLEELVFVFANGEHRKAATNYTEVRPKGLAPALFASNIGCWSWTGWATISDSDSPQSGTITISNILLESLEFAAIPAPSPAPAYMRVPSPRVMPPGIKFPIGPLGYQLTGALVSWRLDYTEPGPSGCRYTGSADFAIGTPFSPMVAGTLPFNTPQWIPKGSERRHVIIGSLMEHAQATNANRFWRTVSCPDPDTPTISDWDLSPWWLDLEFHPDWNDLAVSADGRTIAGNNTSVRDPNNSIKATFRLDAQVQ